MSKLNWRNARLDAKRSLSTVDEDEYRGRDAAARWLDRNGKSKTSHKPNGRRLSPHPKEGETQP